MALGFGVHGLGFTSTVDTGELYVKFEFNIAF
jgi:hypothetical protein